MSRILILGALLLAGCASAPDYRAPTAHLDATRRFATAAPATDANSPAPQDWWRLYDDPALDRLVTRALAANTDLRVAMANLRRARAVVREAGAARLPATTLSGDATYGDAAGLDDRSRGAEAWSYDGRLAVSWEVDLFGRLGRAVEAAKADAEAAAAAADVVRVTVAAETARAYLDACAFAQSAAVARESQATAGRTLNLVASQEAAGAVGRFEVERAAAAHARARAALPPLEAGRQSALLQLAALIGQPPSALPAEAAACGRPPRPSGPLPVGDGAGLLRRRPDLRVAERRLAADTARVGVATADLYPRISLGGLGGRLGGDAPGARDATTFSIGPLLSWSFPSNVAARARLAQADAQAQAALASFDGQVLTALREAEQALANYGAEHRRRAALDDARDRAEAAYRIADARYRAGAISNLDLLIAQSETLETRASLAQSEQALGSRRIDLFKALGGGWGAELPSPPIGRANGHDLSSLCPVDANPG